MPVNNLLIHDEVLGLLREDGNYERISELYSKEVRNTLNFGPERYEIYKLLMGKPYAPEFGFQIKSLDKISVDKIQKGIELATKLEGEYNIK